MGTFIVTIDDGGKTRRMRVSDVADRNAATLKAQAYLDAERSAGATDDYGHPLAVPAPQGDNVATRYAKEFGKGAVAGAASILDIPMNVGGYIGDQWSRATGAPRGGDIRQTMRGGAQGWVERNILPPPVQGYEGTRHAGEFVGAAAGPGGILRGARMAPELIAGGRGVGNVAGNLIGGAGRDLAAAGAGAVGAHTGGAALGAAGHAAGTVLGPDAQRRLEVAGETVGTLGGGMAAGLVGNGAAQRPRPGYDRHVEALREADVPMTAGQETGNTALRAAEDVARRYPLSTQAAETLDTQGGAFNRAVGRLMGYDLKNPEGLWTPDEWLGVKDQFRQRYGDLTSRNTLVADQQMLDAVDSTGQWYGRDVAPGSQNGVVQKWLDDVAGNGQRMMPGNQYQQWYSDIGKDIKRYGGINGHAPTADALTEIRQALSDNMGRSMLPEDTAAWNELNRQYSNYKTVQQAANGAGGEVAANYGLSPARLRQVAARKAGGAYNEGRSDMGNLARAGEAVMTPPRSSGTAERLSAQNLGLSLPWAGVGAGVGGAVGGVPGAAVGSALGGAVPAIVSLAQSSRLGQAAARGLNSMTSMSPGSRGVEMFQRYAPAAAAMPAPIDLPTIQVRGQQ